MPEWKAKNKQDIYTSLKCPSVKLPLILPVGCLQYHFIHWKASYETWEFCIYAEQNEIHVIQIQHSIHMLQQLFW